MTEDLNLWVRRTGENRDRIRAALADFGLPLSASQAEAILRERSVIWFGVKPRRIELLNFLDGCDWPSAFERAEETTIEGVTVRVLALPDYVATKMASGRPKNAQDLIMLREVIGSLPGDPTG